jgi:hypothetical protein
MMNNTIQLFKYYQYLFMVEVFSHCCILLKMIKLLSKKISEQNLSYIYYGAYLIFSYNILNGY